MLNVCQVMMDKELCMGCDICVFICPSMALSISDKIVVCNDSLCIKCGTCIDFCPYLSENIYDGDNGDDLDIYGYEIKNSLSKGSSLKSISYRYGTSETDLHNWMQQNGIKKR